MKCSTGCGSLVYPSRGQCLTHLDPSHVPGHPWLACDGCGRALDRLLGDDATEQDKLCNECEAKHAMSQ